MEIEAAVVRECGEPFQLETLDLETPRPDEVVVQMVATGICHTDLFFKDQASPLPLPAVLGHEGAGIIVDVGADVRKVRKGDQVVLTFGSCGQCENCRRDLPAYCHAFLECNAAGTRRDGTTTLHRHDGDVSGVFFSQSSFANYALATERNVVKVPPEAPLEMLGPLGCGIQTGAGAVLNTLRAERGSSIAIFGCGAVGLSAVMAAATAGCSPIIGIDVNDERLALARELGATAILDARSANVVEEVRGLTEQGVHNAIEATGRPDVMNAASETIVPGGTAVLLGVPPLDAQVAFDAMNLIRGITIKYALEGDSDPDRFIPHLVELHAQGEFPFHRLIRHYDFERINDAVHDMETGAVIKPVLRMSGASPQAR